MTDTTPDLDGIEDQIRHRAGCPAERVEEHGAQGPLYDQIGGMKVQAGTSYFRIARCLDCASQVTVKTHQKRWGS